MNTPDALRDWIVRELGRRGWSQREWSLRAGLASNMVSLILNGHLPSERTLRAIAVAVNVDENFVLYLGGYIERNPMQGRTPEIESLAERLEELPERKLRALLPIVWAAIEGMEDL